MWSLRRAGRGGGAQRRHRRARHDALARLAGDDARAAAPTGRSASRRAARALLSERRRRRGALPRGDRAARPHAAARRARARAPALRRVAAPRGPARRRPRAAPHRPRACSTAIGMEAFAERARRELLGHRREGRASARPRRATSSRRRRSRSPGSPRDGLYEPGDRRAAVPQPAHRRVAPEEGVHEARDQLAHGPARRAAARGPRGRARLAPGIGPGNTRARPPAGGEQAPRMPALTVTRSPTRWNVTVRQPAGEPRRSGDDPRAPGARRRARPRHRRDRGGLRQRRRRPLPRPVRHVARGRHPGTPGADRACRRGSTSRLVSAGCRWSRSRASAGPSRGVGQEFALACDLRFASLERTAIDQPEVRHRLVPGGGAIARLPALAGRARALELILGSAVLDGATAERYGVVNRAVPDAELDGVRRDARRTSSPSSTARRWRPPRRWSTTRPCPTTTTSLAAYGAFFASAARLAVAS